MYLLNSRNSETGPQVWNGLPQCLRAQVDFLIMYFLLAPPLFFLDCQGYRTSSLWNVLSHTKLHYYYCCFCYCKLLLFSCFILLCSHLMRYNMFFAKVLFESFNVLIRNLYCSLWTCQTPYSFYECNVDVRSMHTWLLSMLSGVRLMSYRLCTALCGVTLQEQFAAA